MHKTFAALAVVSVFFGSSPSEARSPFVEARLKPTETANEGHGATLDHRATLWNEARSLLRERSVFPWEVERVRRSIARAPQFYVKNLDGSTVWVTQLHRSSGCLIGEPIVTDPACP